MRKGIFYLVISIILINCSAYPIYRPPGQIPPRGKPVPTNQKTKINKDKMDDIINSYLGTPYRENGTSRLGIDCSGLVREVYRRYSGINLPHDTKKLYTLVKDVKKRNLLYGDLVFFALDSEEVSHIGIYLGEGQFVHASSSQGVIISSLNEDYYRKNYVGARRVIP